MMMISLFLVLYCSKKHGSGEPLKDYSPVELTGPPEWAKTGVIYEVFPRVFTREGTFKVLQEKLDYIKDLGVNIIWIMPIYPIGEKGRKGKLGSPYAVRDLLKINPDYGSEVDFSNLVQAIHQKEMKIILDIVPNHGSTDHVRMREHPSWFSQDAKGEFTRKNPDWTDVVDYNYNDPGFRRYMLGALLYWVREFDIDGYRCDVAGMVPYNFWKDALLKLKGIKNDIFLLAEWEDPEILLNGFHSDYGWTEYHTFNEVRQEKRKSSALINLICQRDDKYPQNALPLRFLENHDENRSSYSLGREAIEAYANLLFTLPGIPLLYAGQEMGEVEKPSLFEKSKLDWDSIDLKLFKMYQYLIQLRKQYSCFTRGEIIPLRTSSAIGTAGAFMRKDDYCVALVVTNLLKKFTGKVLISIPAKLRNQLMNLTFINHKDPNDTINVNKVYFEKLPSFKTLVYLGVK
jgi:cyclomaltodextrinase